jgi:hypothetical protein
MLDELVIDGDLTVRLDGERGQGTRHEIRFGVLSDSDERVAVKVGRLPGALQRERRVLAWLGAAKPGLAPRLLAFGNAILDGEQVTCLVAQRCPGSPPRTVQGWGRMGAALAQLAGLGHPDDGLPLLDAEDFVRAHAERLSDLGSRLDPFVRSIPDWEQLACTRLPASTAIVLTHGDPGPGNYLDTGTAGTLIDWEGAQIAPLGLDLGRLTFIALLGSGPAGYRARDHQVRSHAAAAGYLHALEHPWAPTRGEFRWWLSVAAIQFIHRRWQLGGRPAPWEQAADVLVSALAGDHNLHDHHRSDNPAMGDTADCSL